MRVTRVRLSDGTRVVGIKVPYQRLKTWKMRLSNAGVQIDEDARKTIDLIEKDAEQVETRSRGDKDEQEANNFGRNGAAEDASSAGASGRKRKAREGLGRREINTDYY